MRRGDTVLRRSGPHGSTVIAFLRHLHDGGLRFVPRPIGTGFADDGRERLGFIDGEVMHPRPWSEAALWTIGGMLRQVHDASTTFVAPRDASWHRSFMRDLPGGRRVIGHGDLGPWNVLARNGAPVALIDWDDAGPMGDVWDLANVVWLNAQLHDDDVAAMNGLPSAAVRARHALAVLDGYGLDRRDRRGFVQRMIEVALRSAREEAEVGAVTPRTPSPAPNGFPTLWAITWRVRAAAWMLDHATDLRRVLER